MIEGAVVVAVFLLGAWVGALVTALAAGQDGEW